MSEAGDCSEPAGGQPPQGRRALLIGAGVTCAALLTGCTTYDASSGGFTGQAPAAAPATGGAALTTTPDVPEGGGKIINARKIVVTQPQAGTFKAFSAVCTHQGCLVSTVSDGTIDCPCHGSKFSVNDGSVVHGPATAPLPPVAIKVEGTSIVAG
jgi:nitrite reductase/ring-hydroxylating ferredoxin subunit